MRATRLLITVWLCLLAAVALPAQGTGNEGTGNEGTGNEGSAAGVEPAAAAGHGEQAGHGPALHTMEMSNSDIFKQQFSHSVPYPIALLREDGTAGPVAIYNVHPWQWICIGLMFLVFLPVVSSFGKGGVGRFTRIMRGFCLWVRDEMVYSVMGKEEGRAFVPLFFFMFFFVTFQNVIGLIPSAGHHFPLAIYTATGTPMVTAPLAIITLALMLGLGFKKNGVLGFFKGLVPHGLPLVLWPIMFVIEFVSLFVKPFALTIRLFANMLSGHLVIAAAIGLVFLFTKMLGGEITSYVTALPCVGMAIFIYIIEAFVTLLQAYIFTFLSITFIHQAIHQDH